jgi:hypothetical protein
MSTAQRFPCENIIQHNLVGEIVMKLQLKIVSLISLLPFRRGVLGGRIPQVSNDDVLGGMSASKTVSKLEVSESKYRRKEYFSGRPSEIPTAAPAIVNIISSDPSSHYRSRNGELEILPRPASREMFHVYRDDGSQDLLHR